MPRTGCPLVALDSVSVAVFGVVPMSTEPNDEHRAERGQAAGGTGLGRRNKYAEPLLRR
jgi:hypothetical protein